MRVALSTISSGSLEQVTKMLESAARYVHEAVIVVAPGHLAVLDAMETVVPVTRIECQWKGYAKTRTVALKEAEKRADWVLTLDDDDRLETGGELPPLASADAYLLPVSIGDVKFYRRHLTKKGCNWRFEGCGSSGLHEALYGDGKVITKKWDKLKYLSGPASAPSIEKYNEHVTLLQLAANETPSDTRTAFYLAQSLRDVANLSEGDNVRQLGEALAAYVRRGNMSNGFTEETFWAWLNAGRIAWRLGMPWEACISFFKYASTWGPGRAEPLLGIAGLYEAWGKPSIGKMYRELAARCIYPTDALLFVEKEAYK